MIRTMMLSTVVVTAWLATPLALATSYAQSAGVQTPRQVTPGEAARFMGDWTLALQGPNGPGTFALAVKVENEKVVGEIAAQELPKQAITNISMDKESLVLSYTFDYQGNPVDTVVSLTPQKDDTVAARIDFAGGAYTMTGPATKKDASKL
jgi:hypothetical protein